MAAQETSRNDSALYADRAEIAQAFGSLFANTQLLQKEILFLATLILLVAGGGWAMFIHIDSNINEVRQDIRALSIEVTNVKNDIVDMKKDIQEIKEVIQKDGEEPRE